MAGLRRFRYRTAWPCDDNPAIGSGPPGVAGAMRGDRVHRHSGGCLAFVLRGRPVAPGRSGRGLGLGGGGNGLPPAALACPALRLPGQCRLRGPRAQLPGVRAALPAWSRVQLAGDRHVRPAPRPRVVRARRGLRAAGARRAGGVLGRRRAGDGRGLPRGIADGTLDPAAGEVVRQCARHAADLRHSLTGRAPDVGGLLARLRPALRAAEAGALVNVQVIGDPAIPPPRSPTR